MKTLSKTFSSLTLIAVASCFGLLTACGEGFEASKMEGLTSEPDQIIEDEINRVPEGQTPVEVDQSIYDSFSTEMGGLNQETVRGFVYGIKAFGLELQTTEHPGGASSNTTATSLLINGCASHQRTEIYDSSVDYDALLNGDRVVVGNNGLYEIMLECTLDSCDEMMAIIRRQGDDSTDAIAFIGLEKDRTDVVSSRVTTRSFIARRVQTTTDSFRSALEPMTFLTGFCTFGSGDDAEETETAVDPLGGTGVPFVAPTQEFRWPDPVGPGDSL